MLVSLRYPLAESITEQPWACNSLKNVRNTKVAEAELATMEKKGMDTGLTAAPPS